jgi:hypothetical protein
MERTIAPMAKQDNQEAVYKFLREHARSGATFTTAEMGAAVGWKGQTARTYISKQYADYLEVVGAGTFRVLPEFKRTSFEEFLDLVTQVRHVFAVYDRSTYEAVVVFDFLLPLTREDKLRKALDDLFFRDTLERRIHEAGLDVLARYIAREPDESDDKFVGRLIDFIDARIGGFSISHVSGRFRMGPILTREESGQRLAKDQPYLIDETTAVVRFIIPCIGSRASHGADFGVDDHSWREEQRKAIAREVLQIRGLFFEIFVEGVVPTIRGEALIWMLETSPKGQRLYELTQKNRRERGAADHGDTDDEATEENE